MQIEENPQPDMSSIFVSTPDALRAHNMRVADHLAEEILRARGVIASDFDGTFVFTEEHQMKAFAALVTKQKGISLCYKETAREMLGRPEMDIVSVLKNRHGLVGDLIDLVDKRGHLYVDSVISSGLKPNPSVVRIFDSVVSSGGKKPLVVTNGRHSVQMNLLEHWGMQNLFHKVYASDTMMQHLELGQRKPAFLSHLPSKYDLNPSQVYVFEDSKSIANHVESQSMKAVYVHHALNEGAFRPRSGHVIKCGSLLDNCFAPKD